jgi:hypothetical protein
MTTRKSYVKVPKTRVLIEPYEHMTVPTAHTCSKTRFLRYSDLEEEVYVTQPQGFGNGDVDAVCKLKKAPYGLKHHVYHVHGL